jgi:hypothetical protein
MYIAPPTSDNKPTSATTPERPKTSHSLRKSGSLRNRLSGRPTTSGGDQAAAVAADGMATGKPKESKRRWSSGLRSLFHRHE